jgi:hypothetical protein
LKHGMIRRREAMAAMAANFPKCARCVRVEGK